MTLVIPCGLVVPKKFQQPSSAHFIGRSLDEKGASPPRAYQRVDLANQVFRK
jgi:hypothetical protein